MLTSQNDWEVATVEDVHYYPIPGDHSKNAGTVALRKGIVATVLLALMGDLQKIQPAVWPGMWGWFVRPIRGETTGYSNHASATAFDWRAPIHPRQSGSRYLGWTDAQVNEIHALLAGKYRGLVRWGGDYRSKPYDPMHFEINARPTDPRLAELAAALTRPTPPGPPTGEDDMGYTLAQFKGTDGKPIAAVFASDGKQMFWVGPGQTLEGDWQYRAKKFHSTPDTTVYQYDLADMHGFMLGGFVGAVPPGWALSADHLTLTPPKG